MIPLPHIVNLHVPSDEPFQPWGWGARRSVNGTEPCARCNKPKAGTLDFGVIDDTRPVPVMDGLGWAYVDVARHLLLCGDCARVRWTVAARDLEEAA